MDSQRLQMLSTPKKNLRCISCERWVTEADDNTPPPPQEPSCFYHSVKRGETLHVSFHRWTTIVAEDVGDGGGGGGLQPQPQLHQSGHPPPPRSDPPHADRSNWITWCSCQGDASEGWRDGGTDPLSTGWPRPPVRSALGLRMMGMEEGGGGGYLGVGPHLHNHDPLFWQTMLHCSLPPPSSSSSSAWTAPWMWTWAGWSGRMHRLTRPPPDVPPPPPRPPGAGVLRCEACVYS